MRAALIASVAAVSALSAPSQTVPVFQIDFSNPGLSPSHWTLTLQPDGSGHFRSDRIRSEQSSAPVANALSPAAPNAAGRGLEARDVDRDIRVSEEFAQRVFQTAQRKRWFGGECESHLKVAFQGVKKLSYDGPDGHGSCEFNYSKDKEIQELGEALESVATTILEGARLEMRLQHDRLGLDEETEYLVEAAGNGEARQICAIREILERLADNPALMERVRRRARELLARADR
jgi:hypothetical protein